MSESLRDLLQRGADTVERPRFDVGDLVARAERRLFRRRLAMVVASAAAVVLIAAGGFALRPDERPAPVGPGPAQTEPRTFYYDEGTRVSETGERNVVVRPGVYAVPFSGWGDLPPEVADLRAVVAFPEGWTSLDRSTFEKDTSDKDVALEFWTVDRVPENLCAGGRPLADLTDPGPTVAALANALAAQPRLAGTDPSPVTIGGHDGLYVELTRPPSWRCAGGPLWVAPRIVHAAYPEGFIAGDVARVWILDVDGDRVVINSVHPSGTPQEDVDEVTRMVESTTFMTLE